MAHIVFILGSYHPNFQAVGICVRNVINELKRNNEISIICQKTQLNEEVTEEFDGTKIIRTETKLNNFKFKYLDKSKKSSGIKKKLFKLISDSVRVYRYLDAIFSKIIIQHDIVDAYMDSLNHINQKSKIDLIVPCASPFESCVASMKFKAMIFPDVKIVPYLFDNFASNTTIYRNSKLFYKQKYQNHIQQEKLLIGYSETILCMKHYADSFLKIHNNEDILSIVEHPLLINPNKQNNFGFNKNKINVVYTGGLFKKIRNPEYALSVFQKIIENNSKIVIHIFGSGDCKSIIDTFVLKHPNQIINHGYVNVDTAEAARNSCDYLLSIGNISNNQLPSKIFEYMASLKPIIHFAKIKEDKTIHILDNYANKCILYEDFALNNCNISKLRSFLNAKVISVSFEELEERYFDATPKFTSRLLIKQLQ
jgi:glycosyltransferase involved in cell wall biosynthesis